MIMFNFARKEWEASVYLAAQVTMVIFFKGNSMLGIWVEV